MGQIFQNRIGPLTVVGSAIVRRMVSLTLQVAGCEVPEAADRAFGRIADPFGQERPLAAPKEKGAGMAIDHRDAFVEGAHEVRDGRLLVTTEPISIIPAAKDQIRLMLDRPHTGEAPEGPTSAEIFASFQRLASGMEARDPSPQKGATGSEGASPPPIPDHDMTCRTRLVPSRNIFLFRDEASASSGRAARLRGGVTARVRRGINGSSP